MPGYSAPVAGFRAQKTRAFRIAEGYLSNMAVAAPQALQLRAASLFDVDPELREVVDPRHLAAARPRAIVPVADLPAGPWSPETVAAAGGQPFALMVVEGLL